MAIKSHYGIAQAGGIDNAKLNSRSCVGSDTKMFFACDEASGATIITDFGPEGFILNNADTDVTIADSTVTNAKQVLQWTAIDNTERVPNAGNVTAISPLGNSFVVFIGLSIFSAYQLANLTIGGPNGKVFLSVSGTTGLFDGTTIVSNSAAITGADGSKRFLAIIVDRENAIFTASNGLITNIAVPKAIPIAMGDIIFDNLIQVSTGAPQNVYGFGMRVFPKGVPATIYADLVELKSSLEAGKKVLPTNWLVNQ